MNQNFMKEKPVAQLVFSMALPMVISMAVNSLYNIVDSFFVAKISEDAMTALSLVYPIQNFISAAAIGFGVGINAVIALCLGSGDKEQANAAATQGVVLSVIHGIILTVLCISIMPMFLRLFTSSEKISGMGLQYSSVAFSFTIIIMLGITFEKIFQAVGCMKISMCSLTAGCVANIILDPLLIFGIGIFPEMGIRGAALATGLGQTIGFLIYLILYFVRPIGVKIQKNQARPEKEMVLRLYSIGIPAALNLALPSLMISALNAILASFSEVYILVLGIYYKLQTFLYLPANGFVQGMRPLIGFNYGAGEQKRVGKIFRLVLLMNGLIMAAGTIVCLIVPGRLMGLFTENSFTISAGETALRIICAGFVVSAVSVTACGALEGIGKGVPSLIISMCRYVIIILPVSFVFSRFMGAAGVWHGFWTAEAATAVIAYFVYRWASRQRSQKG